MTEERGWRPNVADDDEGNTGEADDADSFADHSAAGPPGDTVADYPADGGEDRDGLTQAGEVSAASGESTSESTAIFLDSSAIVALVDRDDASHAAAVDAYRNLVQAGYKLFTTNYVIAETFDLLRTGVGPLVARQFLHDCKLAIYHADEQDERRARRQLLDAPGGSNLTLVDAVSLVVMERLGVADAFAVDPAFLGDGR